MVPHGLVDSFCDNSKFPTIKSRRKEKIIGWSEEEPYPSPSAQGVWASFPDRAYALLGIRPRPTQTHALWWPRGVKNKAGTQTHLGHVLALLTSSSALVRRVNLPEPQLPHMYKTERRVFICNTPIAQSTKPASLNILCAAGPSFLWFWKLPWLLFPNHPPFRKVELWSHSKKATLLCKEGSQR